MQFLCYFLLVLEARSKFTAFYTEFWIDFGIQKYYFAAALQTSTVELLAFFQIFQTEEGLLRVNKNTFNGDHFVTQGNFHLNNDGKSLFWVFWQICDPWINPQTTKLVYLHISKIVCFLQFLCHFLLLLEAGSKLTVFHTKFCVKTAIFCVQIYQFADVKQTSPANFPAFSQIFQSEERVLRVKSAF